MLIDREKTEHGFLWSYIAKPQSSFSQASVKLRAWNLVKNVKNKLDSAVVSAGMMCKTIQRLAEMNA